MYKCKHFAPYELVPPEIYNKYTNKDEIYDLFEENFLKVLDLIREWSGVSLVINDWFWKGKRRDSGYRAPNSTVGATKSAHKPDLPKRKACAADIISNKLTTKQLWAIIDNHRDELPCKIRIEKTSDGKLLTWLHVDTNTSATQPTKIYYFIA